MDDVFDPPGADSGGDSAAYDTDIFAWSQRQAEVLRSLARSQRDLPNELDLEHVADEIEDLGISELRRVETLLRRVPGHGIKLASSLHSDAANGWRKEIRAWQADALTHYTKAMRQRVDLAQVWRLAVRDAKGDLGDYGEQALDLPPQCPLTLGTLLHETFGVEELVVAVLAAAAGTIHSK